MNKKLTAWILMAMVFLTPVLVASAQSEAVDSQVADMMTRENMEMRKWRVDWKKSPYAEEMTALREKMCIWAEEVKDEASNLRSQFQEGQIDQETLKAELEALGVTVRKRAIAPRLNWSKTAYAEQVQALREQVKAGEITAEEAHTQLQTWAEELKTKVDALHTEHEAGNITDQELKTALETLGVKQQDEQRRLRIQGSNTEQAQALREQVKAGEITIDEARAQMQAWAEALKTQVDALHAEYEAGNLTEEELHSALQALGVGLGRGSADSSGPMMKQRWASH